MSLGWLYFAIALTAVLTLLGAVAVTTAQQQLSSGERTVSVTGEVVCLPHKKAWFGLIGGPETLECNFGFHGEDGRYYGLNFLDSESLELLAGAAGSGELFAVTGAIRIPAPYEGLDRYNVVGAIDVAAVSRSPMTTLYLFKPSPDAPGSSTLHYGSLYIKVRDMVGGLDPVTFEQAHYTLGKEGVFNYTGKRIGDYGNVRIVVSESITKPDGSLLLASDISPETRFYYSSLNGAALIEDSGGFMAWNQINYDNPNRVKEDEMIRAVALPVEAQDVDKIESRYEQVRQTIESYKMTEEDLKAFEKEYPDITARP